MVRVAMCKTASLRSTRQVKFKRAHCGHENNVDVNAPEENEEELHGKGAES